MSQDVEAAYDTFLSNMGAALGKISTELAMQVMYYERKFPQSDPCVNLDIHYRDGIILEKKQAEFSDKYGFASARMGKNHLLIRGNMSLHTMQQISSDVEIEKMTGSASCASY